MVYQSGLVLALSMSLTASAADYFVRDAVAPDLSKDQQDEITMMVRHAVRLMPDQNLVESETDADYVLQPAVVDRSGKLFLVLEKDKGGQVIAKSERALSTIATSRDSAVQATNLVVAKNIAEPSTRDDHDDPFTVGDDSQFYGSDDIAQIDGTANSQFSNLANQGTSSSASVSAADSDNLASDRVGSPTRGIPLTDTGLTAGDVRAPSPIVRTPNHYGTIEAGIGPAFAAGLGSDQPMIDMNVGYAVPITQQFSAKGFGDLNFASGNAVDRFINFGLGADIYPLPAVTLGGAKPYLTGDLGYALTRNQASHEDDALAVGGGGGFRFAAQELNLDIGLHYTILTAQVDSTVPSVLALRAAMNF